MTTSMLTKHTTTTTTINEDDVQTKPKTMFSGEQGRFGIAILTKEDL